MAKQIDIITTFVKWLDLPDGRDKAAKVIQFTARLLAYHLATTNKDLATKCNNLMGCIRDCRKLFRFGKEVADYQKIQQVLESNQDSLSKSLNIISRFGMVNYWFWDHVNFLAKFKVLSRDPAPYARYSGLGWFVGILLSLLMEIRTYSDIIQLEAKLSEDKSKSKELGGVLKKKLASQLNITRNACDLIVAASLAQLPNNIIGRPLNEYLISVCGITAGLISCYSNISTVI